MMRVLLFTLLGILTACAAPRAQQTETRLPLAGDQPTFFFIYTDN